MLKNIVYTISGVLLACVALYLITLGDAIIPTPLLPLPYKVAYVVYTLSNIIGAYALLTDKE